MKIKNPETGEVIVVPQGMEDDVRNAIESGNDPMEVMQMKYGGIHINPANKGKFNATKKATGKTTEELTHSKNPLTRKRAIFAQNAKKWKHQDGGQAMEQQDQMQQLIQIAEQALAQGASPEEVAQMLVQKGVPEQVVQQVIQYAIQDLEQTQGQNPQEEAQEQGQQQNPQEEQAEMKYGGIHIKESKKGTFTAAATKHGMGVQEFAKKVLANKDNYSPAMVKKANFAHNAASWHHEYGGMAMYEEGGQLPESLLRTRMKASGASNEEINDYISKNYNYGGMTMYGHGGMIKRADGSYSKRGLWDNIRANKGSGKAPTKEMLEQEKKIKAAEKGMGGMMYADGGKLPKDILKSRLESHMSPQEVNNYLKEYANGGSFDNPGFRALPMYVQEKIKSNMAYGGCMECGGKMETGGRFLRKAQVGIYDDNLPYNPEYNSANSLNTFGNFQNPLDQYNPNDAYNPYAPAYGPQLNQSTKPFISPLNPTAKEEPLYLPKRGLDENENITYSDNLYGYDPSTGNNLDLSKTMQKIPVTPNFTPKNKSNWFNNYSNYLSNVSGGNSYFGRGISHLGEATFDFTKGGLELAGTNISNRNALGDEARNLQNSMRAGYKKVGKRPTDGNAIISKYGGRMMQDGGATYADKMKVSKNSPEADFVAEKGEYIVNNGVASKLETGGSHASGNDTAISLDKSSNPSYVLSDTPRLKQLQFGGKRVSPAKYAEMATVEVLGKTPDQILKGYTAFTKRANTEGKVFGDKISDATNQLLAQKYQKDLATVKQIADQAYHKQEQLKYAMGMDNDLDHAQQVNGIQMSQYGGMQDDVHMNYFNAPAVQYGGSPQLFSDPSELGYNTTQMAYGGIPMAQDGLLTQKSYDLIDQFENSKGSAQGTSMNKGAGYSKTQEAKIKSFVESTIGMKAWNNLPQPIQIQTYSFMFNHGTDPSVWKGLAQAIDFDKYAKSGVDMDKARQSISANDAINTIKNNKFKATDFTVTNNYVNQVLPMQYQSIADNYDPSNSINAAEQYKKTGQYTTPENFIKGQEIYNNTWKNRASDINKMYIDQGKRTFDEKNRLLSITDDKGTTKFEYDKDENIIQYKPSGAIGKFTPEGKFIESIKDAPETTTSNATPSNNVTATNANTNTTATAAAAPTSNYPTYGGGKYPSGLNTPGPIKSTNEFRGGTPEQYTKEWGDSGLDLSGFKTAKEVQEATYKELLKTPEGRDRIREMWKYGNTALGIKKGIGKGLSFDNLSDEDLLKLLPAYTDDMLGVRSLTPVKKQPTDITTPKPEAKESKPPVVESQEVDKKPFEYTPAEEKDTYDIPPVNFYIPQPYGRNPIGLQLAQAQTIRPAKLNIQPELNEYTRGMRGALRGTQGNTSVNVAQQMQGLNNLYGAQNRLFGQKYNFDEQSRMGAEQFNAQAIMNTDAANLQRIAAEQDAIARREGVLDTQRRTDFQAGIENADKQNAYNLSKKYIESTFAPYLNNQGKLNFTYDPITAEKNTKEKSYTASELNKMTPEQRKALGLKFGGSVKKIKLKLRK